MPRTIAGAPALWAVVALLGGCERQPLEQEQVQEQRQLAEEQGEERQELNEEQREERAEAREKARAELRGETRDLREERTEMAHEAAEVNRLLARACEGLAVDQQNLCPIDKRFVQQVSDIDDGVRLRMAAAAGTESAIEHKIDCYTAHRELTGAHAQAPAVVPPPAVPPATPGAAPTPAPPAAPPAATACLLDLANVDFDVDDDDGHVELDLTSDDDVRVTQLRQQAREFVRQAALR